MNKIDKRASRIVYSEHKIISISSEHLNMINLSEYIKKLKYFVIQKQPFRVVLGKGVLKMCNKFPGEHPCRSVI